MKVLNFTERVLVFLSNLLFALMFIIVLIQIAGRFLMQNPFTWTEELSRIIYIWVVFFGSATLVRGYENITIDMVQRRLSARGDIIYKIITDLLALLFSVLMIWGGIKMMKNTSIARMQANSWLKLSYLYLSLVAGAFFTIIFLIENTVRNVLKLQKQGEGVE